VRKFAFEYALTRSASSELPLHRYLQELGFTHYRITQDETYRQVVEVHTEDEQLLNVLMLKGKLNSTSLFNWALKNPALIGPNQKEKTRGKKIRHV
jgi:hypothetical protein